MSATRFGARWRRRGGATSRATMTMADQCVASASNFAVGVVVARLSGPAGLGAFALAYTCWALLTALHRSLITDPMAILGDMRREDRDDFVRRGCAADVTLGAMAACIFAAVGTAFLIVGQLSFGEGLLAVAPWLIFLDLQDYWRWIGFMQGTPKKSLMNDIVFNTVQALAFLAVVLTGQHSVFAVVSAWGLGAAVAALYGFWQFSARPSLRGGVALLRLRWPISRWLAGERTAGWGGSQLYLIVTAALLGPAAYGGLKAAQALVAGPTSVVINAGGSFGLPEASRQLAERGWTGMARVSRLVTGAGVLVATACCIAVLVAAPTLLRLLYGPEFVVYAPSLRIFAISLVIAAFSIRPVLNLTTLSRVRPLFMVQLGRLVFSVAAVRVLVTFYGVTGAAMADLLTGALTLAALLVVQSSVHRSLEETQGRPALRFLEMMRRRFTRNAKLLVVLPPDRSSSAASPPSGS